MMLFQVLGEFNTRKAAAMDITQEDLTLGHKFEIWR